MVVVPFKKVAHYLSSQMYRHSCSRSCSPTSYLFTVGRICSNVPFLILKIVNLCLLFFLVWKEMYQFYWYFSKDQLLDSWVFSIVFLFIISLSSVLVFMISFLLFTLALNCSHFPCFLKLKSLFFKYEYLIHFFLIRILNAINFPQSTVLATFHNFW